MAITVSWFQVLSARHRPSPSVGHLTSHGLPSLELLTLARARPSSEGLSSDPPLGPDCSNSMHKRRPRAPKSVVIPQWAGVPAFQEGAEAAGGGSASSWALRSGAIRGALRTLCSPASPQETSPGPIYFLDPKVTRFGRSCTPAYSMQGRGKSRGEYLAVLPQQDPALSGSQPRLRLPIPFHP